MSDGNRVAGRTFFMFSTNRGQPKISQRMVPPQRQRDPPALLSMLPPLMVFGAYKAISSLDIFKPVERGFFRNDQSIQHPFVSDRVPHFIVLVVAVVLPPICIVASRRNEKIKRILAEVFIYLFGFLMALVLTDILKIYVGRLRPDFIARCKPDYSKTANPDDLTAFIVEDVCTGLENEILNGRKSHPSGHAMGAAFAAVYVMTIWLRRVRQNRINSGVNTLVLTVLAYYPVVVATSRVSDYKHHPLDVLVGCVLGSVFALYTAFYLNGWAGQVTFSSSSSAGKDSTDGTISEKLKSASSSSTWRLEDDEDSCSLDYV